MKTLVLYFFIVLVYRVMGKKELGELSIIDLIVTILIAELAAISIEKTETSIMVSIVPILVLVFIQVILSYLSLKWPKFRDLLDGKPSMIINKGKINFSLMTKLRYSLDDLLSQLRGNGVRSLEDVEYAVLENSGTLSVFEKGKDYPMPLILDGVIDFDTLKAIGKTKTWIYSILEMRKISLNDVFYAFYRNKQLFIIKKSEVI
jgi:uncharacterized membrane protein YcaP (DUF421 family)